MNNDSISTKRPDSFSEHAAQNPDHVYLREKKEYDVRGPKLLAPILTRNFNLKPQVQPMYSIDDI